MIATIPIGQAPQALAYVSNAVPEGDGMQNLQPLGVAGEAAHLTLGSVTAAASADVKPTSVTLFDQGLTQVLQAAVTGLEPKQPYVLALASQADGGGMLEPLAAFMTNPAGSAIVNAVGPIRQLAQSGQDVPSRYLVVASGTAARIGTPVQVQTK